MLPGERVIEISTYGGGTSEELLSIFNSWPVRFASKINVTEDCWEWTACKDKHGYGRYGPESYVVIGAHRYALELVGRKPNKGVAVDHLCRNPSCVRPDHLEEVGLIENTRRGNTANSPSGLCRSGKHPWIPENILLDNAGGAKRCRECRNENLRNKKRMRSKEKKRLKSLEPTPTEKKCTGECGLVKPLEQFNRKTIGKYGREAKCKECYSKDRKARRLSLQR